MGGLTALALVVVAYTLVASKLDRWWITGPMVFVAAGVILGPGGLDVLPLSLTDETVLTITELTLALLLFSDASTVRLRDVEGDTGLPRRLLFVGLPLTVIAGALLAYLMFPEVGLAAAALIATILAPTDAALAQQLVRAVLVQRASSSSWVASSNTSTSRLALKPAGTKQHRQSGAARCGSGLGRGWQRARTGGATWLCSAGRGGRARRGQTAGSRAGRSGSRIDKSLTADKQGEHCDALTCALGARGRIRTDDLPITRRMLGVDLDGSRRIEPAHVGWPVGPDGSKRIQTDRLDDQTMIAHPTENRMPRRAWVDALSLVGASGEPRPVCPS